MSIFDPINRTFGGFNQKVSGLGLPGGLGLLQAGTDILGGQPIGQAVRGGLQTYQNVTQLDEERKRKELVQNLVSKGGFTQEEQALILASQNPAAVAAQIRAQNAAAARPQSNIGQLASDLQKGIISQEDFDAAMAKATYTKPVIPQYTTFDNNLYEKTSSGLKLVRKGTPDLKYTEFDGDLYQETPDGLKLIQKGTTDPKFLTFDNKLFKQTATGLELIEQGTKDTKFITLNDKVYRQDGNNLVEVLDDTKPSFREFDGDLYKTNAEGGLELVQKGTKDSKFVTVNGKVFRQDGDKLVEVLDESKPQSANLINLLATKDFNLNGQLIKKGQVFTLDKNSQTELINQATDLQTGGAIIAPSKVEQVTSPTVDTSKVDELISSIKDDTSDTSLKIDVGTSAGGDIPGAVTDVLNTVMGAFTGSFSPDRTRQVAVLNEANNTIKVPLVKALNRAGSKFAIEQVDKILPQPSNANETFIQRFNALKPRLDIAIKQLAADSLNTELTESERITAQDEAKQLIEYQQNMQSAIDVYRKNKGGAKSEIQTKADEILKKVK